MIDSIGLLEFSSVAIAYEAQDAMLKAGAVDLVLARTICSGKYIVIVSGDVDAVGSSLKTGKSAGTGYVVDELQIPNVHPSILPAMTGTTELENNMQDAIGVVETFTAASAIKAADTAAKAADVIIYRLHLAMAIGGKGYFCMTGDVSSVQAAVDAAVDTAAHDGLLVAKCVIPRPRKELFDDII